ncbi:hypothetical protein [Marinobacter sp. JSM 1782161]|uniref:hypothetical protein n=1 Tax=Marinobacter sp. JSM 1782161 TaxID=2685906 RepID=UPI001402A57E|nr:hypothetical protein [Marinobacter sp. JSM 1782161]
MSASEKYDADYDVEDYFDALIDAGLQRALEMAEEQIREQLVVKITDPDEREKVLYRLSSKAVEKIEDVINDDSKSDSEKAEGVTDKIASSMPEYDSGQSGSLNVSLRYSPEFLTTEVSWDRKIEYLDCDEWKVEMDCDTDPQTGLDNCSYDGFYEKVEYTVEPAYKLFRVVDGNRQLMTKINGQRIRGEVEWSTKPSDWVKKIQDMLEGSGNKYVEVGRAAHFDFDGDIREPGTTLSYVVEADPSSVWDNSSFCDSSHSYTAAADFDSDADGYADFMPRSEYSTGGEAMNPIINYILLD